LQRPGVWLAARPKPYAPEAVVARFPDDKEGNRELAQFLWGNNYWNRAESLRGLVRWLRESNLIDHGSLRAWAQDGDFKEDFEGQ
jgi:hypothetical protein